MIDTTNKIAVSGMTKPELAAQLQALGVKEKYRASQVYSFLMKGAESFEEMSSLPKGLRERLAESFYIEAPEIAAHLVSKIDGTERFLFRLPDGEYAESVLMKYEHGYSLCVSTQVGCKMGCDFCASTKAGFVRSLSAGEILSQPVKVTREKRISDADFRISNIVLMGIGEPLDNFDNVMRFLELANDPEGLCIGMRHISLSTCGLVDKIALLAEKNLGVTLSVSLHAPYDDLRDKLMPVNKRYPIAALISACRSYIKATGRRISFEYSLISGVNDSQDCAKRLGALLSGMICHVNLIPVNEIREKTYSGSEKEAIRVFTNELEKCRINVTVRRRLGRDIEAACGQLRRDRLDRQ